MPNLIKAYDPQGAIGVCNADCYNSQGIDCTCICGGLNHGVGFTMALLNTRSDHNLIIGRITKRFPRVNEILFLGHRWLSNQKTGT